MKRFIKNILVFIIPFVLLLLLKKSLTPYYLGNTYFAEKLSYFEKNQKKINCVFFGSSRVYRHINPVIFDSILVEKNITSFNFATSATFNPESYFIYENFIENTDKNQIKYAILEIQPLTISERNLFTTKATYWQTNKNFKYSISYILNSDLSAKEKRNKIIRSFKGFLFSFFDFRLLKNFFKREKLYGINGYYSLDQELADLNSKAVRSRREEFFKDATKLHLRIEHAKSESLKEKGKINSAHYKKLLELIAVSQKKGIHLFFLLPPRLYKTKYLNLIPILDKLPQENVITLHEYEKHKSLYALSNTFDVGHLNAKGAKVFTSDLAKLVDEKLNAVVIE